MNSIVVNDPKYPDDGKILNIVTYPDPVLKKLAEPVSEFTAELEQLCKDMIVTMYDAPGIGLAAPQIGLSQRVFVLDVDYSRECIDEEKEIYEISNLNPQVFINPVIKNKAGEITYQEGCLSLPDVFEEVIRFENITVQYQNIKGEHYEIEADELLSICIQHENDHLNGIVFIEKLSTLKLNFYRKKLIKEKKLQKRDD